MNDEKVVSWATEIIEREKGPGLLFVKRKQRAQDLAEAIEKASGQRVPWVTSGVPQKQRDTYIEMLKSGTAPLAVATSAWSTGLDIPELRWVAFADEGRAPIWYTQSTVRGSRVSDGKTEFDVYDILCKDSIARREHIDGYVQDVELLDNMREATTEESDDTLVWRVNWISWQMVGLLVLSLYLTCH